MTEAQMCRTGTQKAAFSMLYIYKQQWNISKWCLLLAVLFIYQENNVQAKWQQKLWHMENDNDESEASRL